MYEIPQEIQYREKIVFLNLQADDLTYSVLH